MPSPSQFTIDFFENPGGIFYSGSQMQGKVVIVTEEEKKLRNIRIRFQGQAYCSWHETHGTGKNRDTDHYSATEEYINIDLILWSPPDAPESGILPAGTHKFDFTFTLPSNCPTSFEGAHGHIRYWLKASMDRPWKFDHSCKRVFTVLSYYNLNADPSLMQSAYVDCSKTLGASCCPAGKLYSHLEIARRGVVGGEFIPVTQVTEFRASHFGCWHTKFVERAVLEYTDEDDLEQHKKRERNDIVLQLPPVPPVLLGCSIINLSYFVELKVTPSGASFSLESKLPLVVGTVPLKINYIHQQSMPSAPQISTVTNPQMPPLPPGNQVPSGENTNATVLPPPTYQESMFGPGAVKDGDDNQYTYGNAGNWAPSYPVYPFPQPAKT